MRFNLHTHTRFCDGSDDPESYVQKAVEEQLSILGFSSHAPVPFNNQFAIPSDAVLLEYCKTIQTMQEKYRGKLKILLGLEIDYIPGLTRPFGEFRKIAGLDYVIGSVHLVTNADKKRLWFIDGPSRETYDRGLQDVFDGNIRKAVTAYYHQLNRMVAEEKPDIVGHMDKIKMHNQDQYFLENDNWYRDLVMESLDVIAKSGSIVEVNTRGIYKKRCSSLYPDGWILDEILNKQIPVTISTDAHKPGELTQLYDQTREQLLQRGFREIWTISEKGPASVAL